MRGLISVAISGLLFSVMNVSISTISRGPQPTHPLVTVVVRFFMQAGLSLIVIALLRRGKLRVADTWFGRPANRFKIFLRGAWGIGGLTGTFYTLSSLPIADAMSLILFNIPLAAVLARILLGEEYTYADAFTGFLSTIGVVLVCQPESLFGSASGVAVAPLPASAVAMALFSCVCSAMAFISARRIGPNEDPFVVVLLFAVLGCLVLPPVAALAGAFARESSQSDKLLMLLAGFSGWAGQLFLNAGMQMAPSGPAAVMRYMDLILSILWQSAVLRETPNALKLCGSAMILSTMFSTVWKMSRKSAKTPQAPPGGDVAALVDRVRDAGWYDWYSETSAEKSPKTLADADATLSSSDSAVIAHALTPPLPADPVSVKCSIADSDKALADIASGHAGVEKISFSECKVMPCRDCNFVSDAQESVLCTIPNCVAITDEADAAEECEVCHRCVDKDPRENHFF